MLILTFLALQFKKCATIKPYLIKIPHLYQEMYILGGFMMKKGQKTKTIRMSYGNKDYVARKKKNVVTVMVSQTAQGQLLNAGTLDLETNTWQEGSHRGYIPMSVRKSIERIFTEPIGE